MTAKFNSVKKVTFKSSNIKEDLAMMMFGRSFALAQAGKQCVVCGKQAEKFRDDISLKEWHISSMCQVCQDEVFSEDMRDEG